MESEKLSKAPLIRKSKPTHKLLALWSGRENSWLTYKEIVGALSDGGISERSVARYLGALVHSGELMRRETGYKKTFYRPVPEYLSRLSSSEEYFFIIEESLCQKVRESVNRFVQMMEYSKETDGRISKLISEEIKKMPEKNLNDYEVHKAIISVLSREKLNERDSNNLISLTEDFMLEAFYGALADPYISAGFSELRSYLDNLGRDLDTLLSSYMKLWVFMYEHPGASFELDKYMREKFPGLNFSKYGLDSNG